MKNVRHWPCLIRENDLKYTQILTNTTIGQHYA